MQISDVINTINSGAKSTGATSTTAATSDAFMMILLAQLKNQNPLEPMQDKDMMAQMTQLNSLQELKKIESSLEQMAGASSAGYAASLIGKVVKANLENGDQVEGTVTDMVFDSGKYLLKVGKNTIPLSSIVSVSQPAATTAATATAAPAQTADEVNQNAAVLQ